MNVVSAVRKAKEEAVKIAHTIFKEGLVFETWGNVSSRPTEKQVVITPSGIHYEKLQYKDMIVVNMSGEVDEGKWKPSSELPLHLSIYQARKDVKAIIHTHSILATAFAVCRQEIPVVVEDLAQVVGGPVKVAEYAHPGSDELALNAVKVLGTENNAVLLANHGLVVLGDDFPTALQRCRVIERNAQIIIWSKILGSPYTLGPKEVKELRKKYLYEYGQKLLKRGSHSC
ncbi:MAG: class II aldolase/adducin family protein [Firmicutes bacterium]|nr:class II aldolase/adducin family protein [Bacillota bacterium]